mgnify:CR=1 FL=1
MTLLLRLPLFLMLMAVMSLVPTVPLRDGVLEMDGALDVAGDAAPDTTTDTAADVAGADVLADTTPPLQASSPRSRPARRKSASRRKG